MASDWLQHTLGRNGWQPQSQVTVLVLLGILITLVFGALYLGQVASYASTNREIESLIAVRDRLERTNEQLRAQIAQLETVPLLLSRAEGLGFRPATAADIEYMVIDGYNPNRSQVVVPLQSSDEFLNEAQVYDETFSGWVQQQFDSLRRQFESFGGR